MTRVIFPDHIKLDFSLVIVQGTHAHPPCPRSHTPDDIKERIRGYMQSHPAATALRLATDRSLWDGHVANQVHPSLNNQDHIARIIRKSRTKLLPFGDGPEGLLHATLNSKHSPWSELDGYFREQHTFADGHSFVLCLLLNEYERDLFSRLIFLEIDVYFKTMRKPWTVFSISTWDSKHNLQVVLARITTNRNKVCHPIRCNTCSLTSIP